MTVLQSMLTANVADSVQSPQRKSRESSGWKLILRLLARPFIIAVEEESICYRLHLTNAVTFSFNQKLSKLTKNRLQM